jgi:hypothetical protein
MRPLLLTLLAAAALLLPTSTNAQTSNCFRDAYGRVTCRSTGGFTRITPNPYGNGDTITNSQGRAVPTSLLAHGHILEDLGFVPTLDHYLELLRCPRWASKPARLLHSKLTDQLPPVSTTTDNQPSR